MSRAHALLSASGAHRWLNCPPSAKLCEQYEDKGSEYAAQGTDAHTLGEYKVLTRLGKKVPDPRDILQYYVVNGSDLYLFTFFGTTRTIAETVLTTFTIQ